MIAAIALVLLANIPQTQTSSVGQPRTVREWEFFTQGERARINSEHLVVEHQKCVRDLAGCKARKERLQELPIVPPEPCPTCPQTTHEIETRWPSWLLPALIGGLAGSAVGGFVGAELWDSKGAAAGAPLIGCTAALLLAAASSF